MQQKSNVTVHRTPEEQKEWEQFMKERKARAEERRAKRLAESATCHKAEEKAQEEEDVCCCVCTSIFFCSVYVRTVYATHVSMYCTYV